MQSAAPLRHRTNRSANLLIDLQPGNHKDAAILFEGDSHQLATGRRRMKISGRLGLWSCTRAGTLSPGLLDGDCGLHAAGLREPTSPRRNECGRPSWTVRGANPTACTNSQSPQLPSDPPNYMSCLCGLGRAVRSEGRVQNPSQRVQSLPCQPVVKPTFHDNLRQILRSCLRRRFHRNGTARALTFPTLHTTLLKTVAAGRKS